MPLPCLVMPPTVEEEPMPLIDRIGMDMGSKHSVADGLRWAATHGLRSCGRARLLRTTDPGAPAPKDEEG